MKHRECVARAFHPSPCSLLLRGHYARGWVARVKLVLGIGQEHSSLTVVTKPHSDSLR